MKVDVHLHVLGNGTDLSAIDQDVYLNVKDNQHWFTRILYNVIEEDLKRMEADLDRDGKISTDEYFELIYRFVTSSEEIEGVVLLALDALYSPETGELDEKRTDLWISNRLLDRKVRELNERLRGESDPKKRRKRSFWGPR